MMSRSQGSKPTPLLSHEDCRLRVCVVCLRRGEREVNDSQLQVINSSTKLFKSISPSDKRVPRGICCTCNKDLSKILKGETGINLKVPNEGFSYLKEVLILPNTRGNSGDEIQSCTCLICRIAKTKALVHVVHPYYGVPFNKIFKKGRPQTVEKKEEFDFDMCFTIQS